MEFESDDPAVPFCSKSNLENIIVEPQEVDVDEFFIDQFEVSPLDYIR